MRSASISLASSKSSQEFRDTVFDLAVTVCDRARQACLICNTEIELPARTPRSREVIHRSFEDPAETRGSEEEEMQAFRKVRDEINLFIEAIHLP